MRGIIWARFADHGMVTRHDITKWKNKIRRQQREIKRLRLHVEVLKRELEVKKP